MGSLIERARRRWKEKRRAVGVRPFQSVLCESLLLAAACAGLWHIPVWAAPVVATAWSESDGNPGNGWSESEKSEEWGPL